MCCSTTSHFKRAVTAISLGLLAGCSTEPPTFPVAGIVRFTSGEPVRVGTVELKSIEHGIHARGQIQTDGTFSLSTFHEDDGAVAGKHNCVIVQFVMTEDVAGHRGSKLGVIDRRYSSYNTSGLVVEVLPQPENEIVIAVEGLLSEQPDGNHQHPE